LCFSEKIAIFATETYEKVLTAKMKEELRIMAETKEQLLERYVAYIKKLASEKSPEIFTNGGAEYASELMAVLFQNTQAEARLFCQGFRPDLITREPYWGALNSYLADSGKLLHVLVESDDALYEAPMNLLRETRDRRGDGTVDFRLVREEDRQKIFSGLNGTPCNFAVFDNDKFRLEYDPDGFKAFGSFKHEDNCGVLISLFDDAFSHADRLN